MKTKRLKQIRHSAAIARSAAAGLAVSLLFISIILTGCAAAQTTTTPGNAATVSTAATIMASAAATITTATPAPVSVISSTPMPTPLLAPQTTPLPTPLLTLTPTSASTLARPAAVKATPVPTAKPFPTAEPRPSDRLKGVVVVLDPGHQRHANPDPEPISPGSTITKAKCSSGTAGVVTRRPEYVVVLEIALKLRAALQAQGCTVYMTRETHDVDISNIERAQFALAREPDVYLRLHCDGSTDPRRHGVGVFVASAGVYARQLPGWGQQLITFVSTATGARAGTVAVNNNYTGLNWATDIPGFLLEMGYMTNPDEDRLLSNTAYQDLICQGISDFAAWMPRS